MIANRVCLYFKAFRPKNVSSFTSVSAGMNGDEVEIGTSAPETNVLPEIGMHKAITPKQLSIAVSKRKKLSRPLQNQPKLEEEEKQVAETRSNKKKRLHTRQGSSNGLSNWHPRYDRIHIPERDHLVSHVSEKLGTQLSITGPFQDAYTAPSVLGMTTNDVDSCLEKLVEAGFNRPDAAAILPYLPSCLTVDYVAVKQMCDLLNKFRISWRLFLQENCHCLLQLTAIVSNNLAMMKEMGMTPQVMGRVLRLQPMLFTCPLKPSVVDTIIETKEKGFNCSWVDTTIKQALLNRPVKITLGTDTKQIVHILKQFRVTSELMLRKHPSFFNIQAHHLLSILEVLCGEPLYFDDTMIALILTTCPQHVTSIVSVEDLRCHLKTLCDVFTRTSTVQYVIRHINRTPSLISPSLNVSAKESKFIAAGFTEEEVSIIANRVPSIFTQSLDEIQLRLKLLLDLTGSSPSLLSKAAASGPAETSSRFLTRQIFDVQSRINYSKKYMGDMCSIDRLNELFDTTDQQFADLFNHTGSRYLTEAMEEQWIDKKTVKERVSKLSNNGRRQTKRSSVTSDRSQSMDMKTDEDIGVVTLKN